MPLTLAIITAVLILGPDLIRRYLPASDTGWFTRMEKEAIADSETEATMKATGDGMGASGCALGFADMAGVSLSFAMPYYVVQGRDDLFSPTPLVEDLLRKGGGADEAACRHRRCRALCAGHASGRGHRRAAADRALRYSPPDPCR